MHNRKFGFTLAEVLITLGIIGVVAALTMPTLIANHQKKVISGKLKKFYSTINQAVKLSEVENGSSEYWTYPEDNNSESMVKFYNDYFSKYINTLEITSTSKNNIDNDGNQIEDDIYNYIIVYFPDGSGMTMRGDKGIDISFYPFANRIGNVKHKFRDYFSFNFQKSNINDNKNTVEPYSAGWNGTKEDLINNTRYGCRRNSPTNMYCGKLLQLNNWEITKEYPW